MDKMEIKKKSSDIQNFSENAVVQNRSDLEDALEMLKTIKKHIKISYLKNGKCLIFVKGAKQSLKTRC